MEFVPGHFVLTEDNNESRVKSADMEDDAGSSKSNNDKLSFFLKQQEATLKSLLTSKFITYRQPTSHFQNIVNIL